MKNKENFPNASNEQIVNKDGYSKYSETEHTDNKIDKELYIIPENSSEINSDEITENDSEWKEMNFDLVQCGDDIDDFNFEFDDQQENSISDEE